MTKTSLFASASAALSAAFLAMPLLAGGAQASVTSDLMKCQFNTKQQVVTCCQRVLHERNAPYWMPGGEGNCAAVTKCVKSKRGNVQAIAYVPQKPRCVIVIPRDIETDGNTPRPRGRTQGRTAN